MFFQPFSMKMKINIKFINSLPTKTYYSTTDASFSVFHNTLLIWATVQRSWNNNDDGDDVCTMCDLMNK